MEFVREVGELWGNQGMEGEEGVMSIEPIAMIVPPELQDLSKTLTPESSARSSTHEGSGANHSSSSEGSSSEKTLSVGEDVGEGVSSPSPESVEVTVDVPMVVGWENKFISGRLSNLRKAPHTLGAEFRFRANFHHEVVDCATSIKGYKRLEEIVRQYHVPRTILLRTGTKNERACIVSPIGWIPMYVDHFDAGLRFPLLVLIFDVLAEYRLAMELVDLEALVTPEVLAVHGFVDVTNLFSEGEMSSMLERQHERAQRSRARGAGSSTQRQTHFDQWPPAAHRKGGRGSNSVSWPHAKRRVETTFVETQRCAREDFDAEDDVPLIRRRLNARNQSGAVRSPDAPVAQARNPAEALPTAVASMGPRIAYPEGFSYTKADCQLAMV
ncbi:hypothetical protein SLEP1_g9933 [Rubroshorea leprosula]|uniref:Uncharacterized protein n=1 Tax=Rubroshorea leprosula TaxID=152421 RepID=A0AAV5IB07_9ROSI|nr:hypothetical protein SLEP1_g9933 [Rubroshorea leprosula]